MDIIVFNDNNSSSFSSENYFIDEEGRFADLQSSHKKLMTAHAV